MKALSGLSALLLGAVVVWAQVVEGDGAANVRRTDAMGAYLEELSRMHGVEAPRKASPEELARRVRVQTMLRAVAGSLDVGKGGGATFESWARIGGTFAGAGDTQEVWKTDWTVRYWRDEALRRMRERGAVGDDRALLLAWHDELAARLVEQVRRVHGVEGLLDEWSEDFDVHIEFEERLKPHFIEWDCNGTVQKERGPEVRTMATYQGRRLTYASQPVPGREPDDSAAPPAPTRRLAVEVAPDSATRMEGETIECIVRVRNLSDKPAAVSRRGLGALRVVGEDGREPVREKSRTVGCGLSWMGDALVLDPGQTMELRTSIHVNPGILGGVWLPAGRWLLSLETPDPSTRLELIGDPAEIEVLPIDEPYGRRIVEWQVGGGSLALRREDGSFDLVDLETGRVGWSGRFDVPEEGWTEGRSRLVPRSDGVSWVLLREPREGVDGPMELSAHPIGPGPRLGKITMDQGVEYAYLVAHQGAGKVWRRDVGAESSELAWVDVESGATGRGAVDVRDEFAVSPQGDFIVERRRGGFRALGALRVRAWPEEAEWREVTPEIAPSADGQDGFAIWVLNQSWFAGRDGVYSATPDGHWFVPYDGSEGWMWGGGPRNVLAESGDGRFVAFGQLPEALDPELRSARIEVWDTRAKRLILEIEEDQRRSVRFVSDPPRLIAVESRGGGVGASWHAEVFEVYDLGSGRLERVMRIRDDR